MNPTILIFSVLLLPTSAFAYIDPGTGMLLWQGLIAAVGALIITVRNPVQAFKGLIRRFRGVKSEWQSPQEAIKPELDGQGKSNKKD